MALAPLKLLTTLNFVSNVVSADLDTNLAAIKTELDLRKFIYFKATFELEQTEVRWRSTLLFDKVIDNKGEAYASSTGVFTAPYPGMYVFTVNMFPRGDHVANFDLHVNGQRVLRGRSQNPGEDSDGYVFPMSLKFGDKVSVVNDYEAFVAYGQGHSFFAGWLVVAY